MPDNSPMSGVPGPSRSSGSSTRQAQLPSEDSIARPQMGPSTTTNSQVASQYMFEGATNFEVKNSILTNAQGDVNIYNFDIADPLNEEFYDLFKVNKTITKMFSVITGAPELGPLLGSLEVKKSTQGSLRKKDLEEHCDYLMKIVQGLMVKEGLDAPPKLKDSLEQLYATLDQISNEMHGNDAGWMEGIYHKITRAMYSFVLVNSISGIIKMEDALVSVEKHVLHQCIQNLPRVDAAYNDYESKKKSGACFEGTRGALLEEIGTWISLDILQIYILSGIAGIGKSTIAYTIAERAQRIGYLGASFFFSRDEVERSNAKRLFTTIAFQLCLYDREFCRAIEKALLTERGLAAITKDPPMQLEALILEPLEDIVKSRSSPIVAVVDALDECDERDSPIVLACLNRLVQRLPCFKVVLTTRPQQHIPAFPNSHTIFHLQDIEEKVVDGDIRLYLEHSLSRQTVSNLFPRLRKKWGASSQDINVLVRFSGRLFIIASTTLRFVLNPRFGDPERRMRDLRSEIDNKQLTFKDLDRFYAIILRAAINEDSDAYIKQRYQDIVGTVVLILDPLPIEALGNLIGSWSTDAIETLLGDLQSIILVRDNTPRIYHKSFYDFVTSCEDDDLRITPRMHHTRLATRCFEVMNSCLRQNILDLGTPARFMDNEAGLAEDAISVERLAEKIADELRYSCVHWANHVEGADPENADLLRELNTFVREHLLHWLEALSWIDKVEIATDALRVISECMNQVASDWSGLVSDALYFIPRFYKHIRRSALHTYYSALPFTPTESVFFKSHRKDMVHGICQPDTAATQWDPLVSEIAWGGTRGGPIDIRFSDDSSRISMGCQGIMKLLNAENGALLRSFEDDNISITRDFSAVASSSGSIVTLWSVASNIPITTITPSEKVVKLALSFNGSRLATGLSDGTVGLWDTWKGELIASLGGRAYGGGQLEFSKNGNRLAFTSTDGTVHLWDGQTGDLVARLDYMSKKHDKFVFSGDSRQLVSTTKEGQRCSLVVWSSEKGNFVDILEDVGQELAISEDGSFIATGGGEQPVQLWMGYPLLLLDTLKVENEILSHLSISCGVLAIGCSWSLKLYDINHLSSILTIPCVLLRSLALSPDCTRLAVTTADSNCLLYDVPRLKVFDSPPKPLEDRTHPSTLAFSPDSSRLASGFDNGTVQLWDTSYTAQPISVYNLHSSEVNIVAFSLGGHWFASGSADKTVRLWDSEDGTPINQLEHSFADSVRSLTFSRSLWAVSTDSNITLFTYEPSRVVCVLEAGAHSLSFAAHESFLASAAYDLGSYTSDVTVWSAEGWVTIAKFKVGSAIHSLALSPNGSQLAVHEAPFIGGFKFFDVTKKQAIEPPALDELWWLPNFLNGVLISVKFDRDYGSHLIGRFSGYPGWVSVLWIPRESEVLSFAVTSSMVALGCDTGRILFVRF